MDVVVPGDSNLMHVQELLGSKAKQVLKKVFLEPKLGCPNALTRGWGNLSSQVAVASE